MTIKTLCHIHKLLEEEVKRTETARKIARDAYYKAEEDEAENAPALKSVYESVRHSAYEAANALREFEEKEW